MADPLNDIVTRIRALQRDLDKQLDAQRERFRYQLRRGRVVFDREIRQRHKKYKVRLWTYIKNPNWPVVLTAPFIYALIIPLVLLDLFVALYQLTCFPAYGIPKVRRRDYIAIDRHYLGYLNGLEKLNCVYCGYANGLLALVAEVASRTEAYWCPIKHARRLRGTHERYLAFADYGDAEHYRDRLQQLRAELARLERESRAMG